MAAGRGIGNAQQVGDARAAYTAYGDSVGWKNYQGAPMPAWEALGATIQRAWVAAAEAVRNRAAVR